MKPLTRQIPPITFTKWLDTNRPFIIRAIDFFLFFLALLSVLSLILRVGFYLSPDIDQFARRLEEGMLYTFVGQAFLKLSLATNKREHVKSRFLELLMFLVILFALIFPKSVESLLASLNPELTPENLTSLYLIITQSFVVLALLPASLRYSGKLMSSSIQPATILLLSFVLLSLFGAGCLLLPKASAEPLSFIDALFISTSAACVTGLSTIDVAKSFTHLGYWIILALIQVGGLGIMTLTTFFVVLAGGSAKLKEYAAMRELLGEENLGKIRGLLFQIGFYTIAIEAAGAVMIYKTLQSDLMEITDSPIFFSTFHAVSAYCNAGFALMSENLALPLFSENFPFLFTIMGLVILGGLGFPVMTGISSFLFLRLQRRSRPHFSLHVRVVLMASSFFLTIGTILFWLLEYNGALSALDWKSQWVESLFHSVVSRTAGFNTLNVSDLTAATLFLTVVLMWIGASPNSTGGGIKTTTATLALLNIYAIASGRNKVELFRRRIPDIAITRAFSTALLSLLYIALALFLLLISEQGRGFAFESLLFEVVSAVSTVGLTTGITPNLSDVGKAIIICSMLVGRVGFLSVIIALTKPRLRGNFDYAEESILVS